MNQAVIAFQVVEPFRTPQGIDHFRNLSRRYHVKEAAEEYAELARKSGHPKCYVREIYGAAEPPDHAKRGR